VLAVSERTKSDVVELYGITPERITVTPHGVGAAFSPGAALPARDYVLMVGAIQARKNPLAAADAAAAVGLPLVVAGPVRDADLAAELERRGASLRGYVDGTQLVGLYREAACLVMPSRYEGFGLPVLEAMACGTPVVVTPDPALREVAGDAAVVAPPSELAEGIRRAIAERERLVAAGLERSARFSWEETARLTAGAYRAVLGQA
jgi:glycosyltransferase involved in cell wall biosynthesis